MSDTASKSRPPLQLARELEKFSSVELLAELERRPGLHNPGRTPNNRHVRESFAEVARHALEAGDLDEAAIQIARSHRAFDLLPTLIARLRAGRG